MSAPLAEAIDLTHAMVSAAKAGDWPQFGRLHERRAQLFKPGLYVHTSTPRLLPRLDAAQKQLATMLGDTTALDGASELLRPMSDGSAPPVTALVDGAAQAMGDLP